MKRIITVFIILILVISVTISEASTPSYILTAKNFTYYGCPSNVMEFDIMIRSSDASVEFIYCSGQYYFNFNPAIANGGTLKYQIVGSDLPYYLMPPTTQISGTQLRLSGNAPAGPENSVVIPSGEEIKIVRMRLSTSASQFAPVSLDIQWRNPSAGSQYTKVFSYNGILAIDITNESGHVMNYMLQPGICETLLLNKPNFSSTAVLPAVLSWYRSSANPVYYQIDVSEVPDFSTISYTDDFITDTFKTVGGLDQYTEYYWRVTAKNSSGYSYTSQVWKFISGFINNGATPTYNLSLKNIESAGNVMEFDIYIEHTNAPATFEYAVGQYFINFNPAIANGGTLTYQMISSDLPPVLRPVNPSVLNGDILGMAGNSPPGAGHGFNMTDNGYPGTKIARMRLTTSASSFSSDPPDLQWRNGTSGSYLTKIFAYVGTDPQDVTTDITTNSTHSIYYSQNHSATAAKIKILFEGFYDQVNDRMRMSDTVTAYLRNSNAPFEIIDQCRSVVDAGSLEGSFLFSNALSGTYYLQLVHRNTIETWSRSGGESYVRGNELTYDFTAAKNMAYGENMTAAGSKWAVYSGDVNSSGNVNLDDVIQINNASANYLTGYVNTDITGDEHVNLTDLVLAFNNASSFVAKVTP